MGGPWWKKFMSKASPIGLVGPIIGPKIAYAR